MKIALVHDYIKEYGGAERVLEAFHEIYPSAPVYTSVYLPKYLGPHKNRIKNWKIRTSWLQYLPFKGKLISPIRLVAPLVFKAFDFSKFDVVLVSATGAYQPNIIKKGKAKHFCFCHTPPRYLYGYATAREWKKNPVFKVVGEIANHFLRLVDFKSAQNVDFFIANSDEVKGRIAKFYRRDAKVIYPPVNTPSKTDWQKEDYYLTGGRLARPKRTDLAVKAATRLGLPLKVFGKEFAGYGEELKKMAGKTVTFLGEVTDEEKYELMGKAKAFIFPAEEEDFGITPVEAMACGTPVIAYYSGGVKETVIEGKTGTFFNELSVNSLTEAINRFQKMDIGKENCLNQAKKFTKDRFKKEIKEFISKNA